jgi:hypothetical protein
MAENETTTEAGGGQNEEGKKLDFFDEFMASGKVEQTPATTAEEEKSTAQGEEVISTETPTEAGGEVKSTEEILREQIANMAAVMASQGITYQEVEEPTEEETEPEPTKPTTKSPVQNLNKAPTWGPVVKISDKDFQDSLESKEVFEKVLTGVRDQAVERTIQSLPQIVTNMVKQQLYLHELSTEFYKANEDLAGLRPFVGVVANEIASKNTGLSPQEVLSQTAVEVRKRLAMKDTATKTSGKQNPGLPSAVNRKSPDLKPQLTGLAKDLEDLIKVR